MIEILKTVKAKQEGVGKKRRGENVEEKEERVRCCHDSRATLSH